MKGTVKPILVVMAAGMGSRFGGLKQVAAVDEHGRAIVDYSLYDAKRAGFARVCFVIKRSIEADFKAGVGSRAERMFGAENVNYVYQELDRLPAPYSVPEGRAKPWGTGHAIACCKGVVDAPFAVINADDFYGSGAYRLMYDFLSSDPDDGECAMVAYKLRNTVTELGSVARGICEVEGGMLKKITERTRIVKRGNDAAFTEDGAAWTELDGSTPVSMNFWGFPASVIDEFCGRFSAFLERELERAPQKCEYFLPDVVGAALREGRATVRVLESPDEWHGITYSGDLENVREAIASLSACGRYDFVL